MRTKLLTILYLGLWLGVGAVVVYGGAAAGASPWLMAALAFVVFFWTNGSLAYFHRSRQLKRQGQQPPSYVQYLFQLDKAGQSYEIGRPVQLPALIRIALGLIVIFGGILFVFGGAVFLRGSIREWIVAGFFIPLGAAFIYVGYRVLRMRAPDQRLLGSLGLRITSYVTATLSVLTLFGAVMVGEYLLSLGGLFGILMAFWLHKSYRDVDKGKALPNGEEAKPL